MFGMLDSNGNEPVSQEVWRNLPFLCRWQWHDWEPFGIETATWRPDPILRQMADWGPGAESLWADTRCKRCAMDYRPCFGSRRGQS